MNRIKELRKKEKLTQEAFCKIIGITQGALSGWENERYEPDLKSVHKMAGFFKVSVDYLLGGDINQSKTLNAAAELTEEDKMDIAYHLDIMLKNLDANEGLMFDGEPMNKRTKEALKASFEHTLIMGKIMSKEEAKNNSDDK
jgi:Predicted transcriptional regulators